jgi:hypothetical protein
MPFNPYAGLPLDNARAGDSPVPKVAGFPERFRKATGGPLRATFW